MALTEIIQIVFSGLIMGGIYALIALGLNLIYGTMRLLNIAHGELIMLGAYITYWLYRFYGVSPLFSMVIVIITLGFIGLFVCKIIFLPIIKTSKSVTIVESDSLLIFFGLSIIFSNVASQLWTANIRGYSYMTKVINVFGVPLMWNRLLALGISLVICIVCYLVIQKTMIGKAIRALIQDKEGAQLVGINTNFIYIISFFSAFAFAGLAGCLLSMFYEISPFMGMPYTLLLLLLLF